VGAGAGAGVGSGVGACELFAFFLCFLVGAGVGISDSFFPFFFAFDSSGQWHASKSRIMLGCSGPSIDSDDIALVKYDAMTSI